MTFWALGKVKNITQKLNLKEYKDYGTSILKSYIQKQDNNQFFDFKQNSNNARESYNKDHVQKRVKNKQSYSNQQWMTIQIQQYKKLKRLEQKLLKQHEKQQKNRLQRQYQQLENQLKQLKREQQEEQEKIQRQILKKQIKNGQKDIKSLIKENILMRQQIQKEKVFQNKSL